MPTGTKHPGVVWQRREGKKLMALHLEFCVFFVSANVSVYDGPWTKKQLMSIWRSCGGFFWNEGRKKREFLSFHKISSMIAHLFIFILGQACGALLLLLSFTFFSLFQYSLCSPRCHQKKIKHERLIHNLKRFKQISEKWRRNEQFALHPPLSFF